MFGNKHPNNVARLTGEALEQITQAIDLKNAIIVEEIADIHEALRKFSSHFAEGLKLFAQREDGLQDQIDALRKRTRELETLITSSHPAIERRRLPTQRAVIPNSAGLHIEYKSSGEETSQRVVIPQQAEIVSVDGKPAVTEFTGYCTMRKAVRTFIISQISAAFDAGTGEAVDPQDWILARCEG